MFAAPQSAAHTPSSKTAVNAEQGLPDTRLPRRAEQGLRSTCTRLSRPRGALLTTGALEEPQTAALCNSLWPETLAPSLHLLAGPTHTPEASSLYLSWWYGSLSSKKQRDPKHSLGWGLTQAEEDLYRRAT